MFVLQLFSFPIAFPVHSLDIFMQLSICPFTIHCAGNQLKHMDKITTKSDCDTKINT